MSKGNMFLGYARGKVGDVVFSRADGEQITRVRNRHPKNPRSFGQNVQRAIFSTIAKAAAAMSPIVDHSFEAIKYGPLSMRYFRKENLSLLRNEYASANGFFALTPKGGSFVPNAYLVSRGALPSFSVDDNDGASVNFKMGVGEPVDSASLNWEQFKTIYPTILPGDQLTILTITKNSGSLADGNGQFVFNYERIILSPSKETLESLDYIMNTTGFNPNALDMTVTTNPNALKSTLSGAGYYIGMGIENQVQNGVYAVTLVLSRQDSAKDWQRSTQYMTVINADDVANNDYAVDSYGSDNFAILGESNEYLDAAVEDMNKEEGISSAYASVTYRQGETVSTDTYKAGENNTLALSAAAGQPVSVVAQAYGTPSNPVIAIDFYKQGVDWTDENYIRGSVLRGNGTVNWGTQMEESVAGTWVLTVVYKNGKSTVNFTLSQQ